MYALHHGTIVKTNRFITMASIGITLHMSWQSLQKQYVSMRVHADANSKLTNYDSQLQPRFQEILGHGELDA